MPQKHIHDIPVVDKYDWKLVKVDTKRKKANEFNIYTSDKGISLREGDGVAVKVNAVFENDLGNKYIQRTLIPHHKVSQYINTVTNKNVNGTGNKSLRFVKVASRKKTTTTKTAKTKTVNKVDGETKKPTGATKPKA